MVVKVLVVADEVVPSIHDMSVRLLEPDLVLGAGDLPWDYLEFLADALDVPVVFVPGNHDPNLPRRRRRRGGFLSHDDDDPRPLGCVNLDGEVAEFKGLRIAGLGGSIRYNSGTNQYTQQEFTKRSRKLIRKARRGPHVDVLLTHSPPRGMGDGDDPPHRGFYGLLDVIEQLQPTWHLHGHIHPYGINQPDRHLGATTIRNVIPFQLMELEPGRPAVLDGR